MIFGKTRKKFNKKGFSDSSEFESLKANSREFVEFSSDKASCNKLAIVALLFSLISILGLNWAGMIGAVLGIVSFGQINNGREKGLAFAVLAVVIGVIFAFGISPIPSNLDF